LITKQSEFLINLRGMLSDVPKVARGCAPFIFLFFP